jgi:two-component system LytT family response regulator
MIKVLIVDDEINALETLGELIALYHSKVEICSQCNTIASTVEAIKIHQPDIVFLDVEMGKENGFDLFEYFPDPDFKVVFTTGHQQYAIQAFRFAALDYLLKPIQSRLLAEVFKKAEAMLENEKLSIKINSFLHNIGNTAKNNKRIILKTADSVHMVELGDILYCEADGGYTNFYFSDKSRIMVSSTLGDYEDLFRDHGFFRIHQSYLLNLSYFKRYEKADGGTAVLKDNSKLPVATRKKELLLQHIMQL